MKIKDVHIELSELIDQLKLSGFTIGIDTINNIAEIYARFKHKNEEILDLISPVICKTAEQYQKFYAIANKFFLVQEFEVKTEKQSYESLPDEQPELETEPETETTEDTEQQPEKDEQPQEKPEEKKEPETQQEQQEQTQKQSRQPDASVARGKGDLPKERIKIYTTPIDVHLHQQLKNSLSAFSAKQPVNRKVIDINATIKSKLQTGVFTPKFKNVKISPEYLFLIYRTCPNDHLAKLYDVLVNQIKNQQIVSDRYFFENSAYVLEREDNNRYESIDLDLALKLYGRRTLIVFAPIQVFYDSWEDDLEAWTKELKYFQKKILVIPYYNKKLHQYTLNLLWDIFDVIITDEINNLLKLYQLLSEEAYTNLQTSHFKFFFDEEDDKFYLSQYLDGDLKKVLAATAVYPDFNWRLTLLFAKLFSHRKALYSWENLRKLFNIQWFQEGYMPDRIRKLLIDKTYLPDEYLQQIIDFISEVYLKSITEKVAKDSQHYLTTLFPENAVKDYSQLERYDKISLIIGRLYKHSPLIFPLKHLEEICWEKLKLIRQGKEVESLIECKKEVVEKFLKQNPDFNRELLKGYTFLEDNDIDSLTVINEIAKYLSEISNKTIKPVLAKDKDEILKYEGKPTFKYLLDENGKVIGLKIHYFEENLEQIPEQILLFADSLQFFDLSYNHISDITALKKLTKLSKLDLSANRISNIHSLRNLNKLTELDLSENKINDISQLKKLTKLIELNLASNEIRNISPLEKFINLSILKLNSNEISDISPLENLTNLTELDIESNKINDISPLKEFIKLTKLNLHYNKISDISPLENLINLTKLNLARNQISDISPLKNLTNLTALDLCCNQISDISPLEKLTNLTELSLDRNQISDISPLEKLTNLTWLDLRENKIKRLPEWIVDKEIYFKYAELIGTPLEGNPLEAPTLEVVLQGREAVKQWFKQQKKYDKEIFYYAKIIIVGDPWAGKTTLLNKLFDDNYSVPNEKQAITHGVNVKYDLKLKHSHKNLEISASVWDFGAQDIQYFLHHFFLSQDALYIIVTDMRSEKIRLNYWLQVVNFLGGNNSRVLVVLNRRDNTTSTGAVDIRQYQEEYPDMHITTAEVNLKYNDTKWQALKQTIAQEVAKLKTVGQEGLAIWKSVKDRLDTLQKPYITRKEFDEIAQEQGMDSEKDIDFMLDYLHRVGWIIYYKDDVFLSDFVFLDPNWITRAIYAPLSTDNLLRNQGRFDKEWIFEFWKKHGYSRQERNMLLLLMQNEKFGICYPLKGGEQYIVPFLLPDKMPEFDWDSRNNLQLRYRYEEFMPDGILNLFIVRSYEMIEERDGKQLVWKSGVILRKGNARAEVLMRTNIQEISIRVSGEDKQFLILDIIEKFNKIFKHFPKQPELLVPCVCSVCSKSENPFFYNLSVLENRKTKHHSTILCAISDEEVSIYKVLEVLFSLDYLYELYKKDLDKALEYALKALEIKELVFDKHPLVLAATYDIIAKIYQERGDFGKALEFALKALEIREQVLDANHPNLATSYNTLALIYLYKGNIDKALEYALKALQIREQVLGEKHPDLANSYNTIASIYQNFGKLDKALEYAMKALQIREQVLGEKHPDLAATFDIIAKIYERNGDFDSALEYALKALGIREQVLDANHPNLANSYNNLALIYKNKGDFDKALVFALRSNEIFKKVLDEYHPNLAASYNNLALIYRDKGDLDKALEYSLKALKIREQVLDADHPDLATSYNNLALIYQDKGDLDKAMEYALKALKIREQVLDANHPDLAQSYMTIASIYYQIGDKEKSSEYINRAIEIFETKFGRDHPNTKAAKKLRHEWEKEIRN